MEERSLISLNGVDANALKKRRKQIVFTERSEKCKSPDMHSEEMKLQVFFDHFN
jgi:hypothetical protein